jgi:hypothetical protein
MPRAAFEVDPSVVAGSDSLLPQMLSQHLSRRFKSTPAEKTFSIWGVDVELEGNTVTIGVKRSKHGPTMWILMVSPGGLRGLAALLRGRRAIDMAAELLPVCSEIHLFLSSRSGISRVRWYFTASRSSVAIPEELPWEKGYGR